MTSTTTQDAVGTSAPTGGALRVRRLVICLLATLAAVAVWVVAVPVVGAELLVESPAGTAPVALSAFVASALTATLLGWALLEVLERFTRRPGRIWTVAALVFLAVSLAGPLLVPGIAAADRLWLALAHLAAAAVAIPLLARTARARRADRV